MPESQPVLPALKPNTWLGREHALCRPLYPEYDPFKGPWVGFGYDHPTTFEFITRESFPSGSEEDQLRLIEQAAIRNLHRRPAHWRIEDVRRSLLRRMRILICSEDTFSAERILDEQFLQQIQAELKVKQMAVGVPCRGLLMATNGRQSSEALARFSAMVSAQYHQAPAAPVTPMVFLAQDGRLVGLVTGLEDSGVRLARAEHSRGAEVYLNAVVSADRVTGVESLHLLAGGPDFDQLAAVAESALTRSLEQMLSRPDFGGQVRIVLVPELVPATPNLPNQMEELEARFRKLTGSRFPKTLAEQPVQVKVEYGASEVAHLAERLPGAGSSISPLLAGLKSADVFERRQSADAIGLQAASLLVTDELIEALTAALGDPDIQVRTLAAEASSRLGEKMVHPLRQVFSEDKPHAREFALIALRGIDEHRFTDLFLQGMKDRSPGVRRRSAGALGDLAESIPAEALLEPLLTALKDSDTMVRALAASGLGRLKHPDLTIPLITALSDPYGEVRSKAAHSLGELKSRRAVPYLVGMVKDSFVWARVFSVWALGEIGDPAGAEALTGALVASFDEPDLQMRGTAAAALLKLGRPAARALTAARDQCDPKTDQEKLRQINDLLRELRLRKLLRSFKKNQAGQGGL